MLKKTIMQRCIENLHLTHWLNRFHVDFRTALRTRDPAAGGTRIRTSRDKVFWPGVENRAAFKLCKHEVTQ